MEISKEQIAKMAESYKKAETQHVAQRAVTKNGILESAESVEVLKRMSPKNFAFSIDVDDQAVANQKMSGRCWMFACLNVLRFHIEKELDLPKGTFELSQAYLAFFNKLERAAWFLEHGRISSKQSKDVTLAVDPLWADLAGAALTIVDAFGIPDGFVEAELLLD